MKRVIVGISSIILIMVALIVIVMAFVSADDGEITRKYASDAGYGFMYPKNWSRQRLAGERVYLDNGFAPDIALSHGAFSTRSMAAYLSEDGYSTEDMLAFAEALAGECERLGGEVKSAGGYARHGASLYSALDYSLDGKDVCVRMLINGGRVVCFEFTDTDSGTMDGVLESAYFLYEAAAI